MAIKIESFTHKDPDGRTYWVDKTPDAQKLMWLADEEECYDIPPGERQEMKGEILVGVYASGFDPFETKSTPESPIKGTPAAREGILSQIKSGGNRVAYRSFSGDELKKQLEMLSKKLRF